MRRVSYQGMLGPGGADGGPPAVYVRLGPDAIGTRRKDARKEVRVELSKAQARWLRDAVEMSGPAIDRGQVLRALVDLGMELDVDWAVIARGTALRAAVRDSVMVRRPGPAQRMAKAWEVPGLRGDARFRDAAGRVILTRWTEMMSHREGTLLGEDIEELHAMRVSSRRLRAAMDAFEGAFPPKSFKAYLRQVKEITDVLGDARDLDVAIERLTGLLPDLRRDERAGIEGLIARYREERAAEDPHIASLFGRIDESRFERRLAGYVEKHTGVRLAKLKPRPPED